MENDESTSAIPYKDTPEVVPSGQRMPVHDPDANTAASKRSRGARQTSRGYADQRQGDTAPYEDVASGRRQDDQEVARARELARREDEDAGGADHDADQPTSAQDDTARQRD
ncbi:MAG TPA: hypothetical protein VE338_00565 [Ktedonobacterales bacterium]|nr:hypothetical protein [Ktedonobacterales bacterium]